MSFLVYLVLLLGNHQNAALGSHENAWGYRGWRETARVVQTQTYPTNIGTAVACASPTPPCIEVILK